MTCAAGQIAKVSINGGAFVEYPAPISYEIIPPTPGQWDYIFSGVGASGGCKTIYSVIYRQNVDVSPIIALDFRSGQSGSCSLPITDVRAKVSFNNGASYAPIFGFGLNPPAGNSGSHFYPSGNLFNCHGSSVASALPILFSKKEIVKGNNNYTLKIYNSNNQIIFQQDYPAEPVVDIQCKTPCPEGTLDCSDCCLDCATVGGELTIIKNMLINYE